MKIKNVIKRSFCMLILMMLMANIYILVNVDQIEASSNRTLAQLQAKFPNGAYWNHYGSSVNNPDGYTWNACTHHGNSYCSNADPTYSGGCGCNGFGGAIQCMGFAYKLGYDAFGSSPRNWSTTTSMTSLKAGDVIRYKNDGHSIFVTGVNGDTITFADCNLTGACQIRWGGTISKSTVQSTLTKVYIAPSELNTSSNSGSSKLEFTIGNIGNGMGLSGSNAPVVGTVKNGGTYPWLQLYMDYEYVSTTCNNENGVYAFYLDTTKYGNGKHLLGVKIQNQDGLDYTEWREVYINNNNSDSISGGVSYTVDNVSDGTFMSGTSAPIVGVVFGGGTYPWLELYVDYGYVSTTCNNDYGSYAFYLDTTKYSDGEHILGVKLKNQDGYDYTTWKSVIIDNNHLWKAGEITSESTCTTAGTRVLTCEYCGKIKNETIAATGHEYKASVVMPTCQSKGYTKRTCSKCGYTYNSEYTEKTGHSYEKETVREATCTADGLIKYTCDVCGDSYTQKKDKIAHVMTDEVVMPTCQSEGYTKHICSKCGYTYNSEYTNKSEHVYEKETVREATYTREGLIRYICRECGYSYEEKTDMVERETEAKIYTVKFNKNGGTKTPSVKKVTYGKKYGILPTVKRTGYLFSGWYTKRTGGSKVTSTTTMNTAANNTLYAHWTKVTVAKTGVKVTAASKKMKVSVKKVSGAAGYEILYSTNKNFESAKKILKKGTTQTITKLKGNTTYYVKTRAYKLDSNGRKVYGSYSKTVNVTVNKDKK